MSSWGRATLIGIGVAGGVVAALSVNVIALKSEGEPVNGARVVLGGEFRVDANGIASFPEIDPGNYTVSAVAPGLGRVTKDVAVEDGKASQVEVRLADASLSGRLREIAAEPSPPFRAKLIVSPTIGPAVRDAIHRDGTFEVEHLPVGSATLSVDADVQSNTKRNFPRYDLDDEEVNLMPGQSEITLDAPISAVETFVRWELLLESGRRPNLIRAGRKYHHPESLRYGCPPREFASDVQSRDDSGTSANDFQVLGQRSLRRWVSHVGDKRFRYRNAAELTVRYEYAAFSPLTATVHAVPVGQLWIPRRAPTVVDRGRRQPSFSPSSLGPRPEALTARLAQRF